MLPRRKKILPITLENHRSSLQSALEIHTSAARVNPGLPPKSFRGHVAIEAAAAVFHLERHPVFAHPAPVIYALDKAVCDEFTATGWVNVPTPYPKVEF